MAYKSGEYVPLNWEYDPGYEVVYGHVTKEVARAAVSSECGWPREGDAFESSHAYMRQIPSGRDCTWYPSQPGRGAMKVTLIETVR